MPTFLHRFTPLSVVVLVSYNSLLLLKIAVDQMRR